MKEKTCDFCGEPIAGGLQEHDFAACAHNLKEKAEQAERFVADIVDEHERYKDALYSIAGTNVRPSHLKYAWKEMMLAAKQRAKEALGGES